MNYSVEEIENILLNCSSDEEQKSSIKVIIDCCESFEELIVVASGIADLLAKNVISISVYNFTKIVSTEQTKKLTP